MPALQYNQWEFLPSELNDTPSHNDGINKDTEAANRIKSCNFLQAVGNQLQVTQQTLRTACVYFHRFYMRHSMKQYHFFDVAATCLYVACKVEECPRRLNDFAEWCTKKAKKRDHLDMSLKENKDEYNRWRDILIHNEVPVFEALCFDLYIEHPENYLEDLQTQWNATDEEVEDTYWFLAQISGETFCLTHEPKLIAAASLLLIMTFSSRAPANATIETAGIPASVVRQLASQMCTCRSL